MGRRRKGQPPTYRLHKQSGQAIVSLPRGGGSYDDRLLGPYDTPESRKEYRRVLAEWEANGNAPPPRRDDVSDLTIAELCLRFWREVESERMYCAAEVAAFRHSLQPLLDLYAGLEVNDLSPLKLKAVREKMIQAGLARKVINQRVGRIKRLVGWAVENELVPVTVHDALLRVKGLRKGKTIARDYPRVRPVPYSTLESLLPHLPGVLRAALVVQYFCGCRAGELLRMRPVDVDRTGATWIYRPQGHELFTAEGEAAGWQAGHKTEWRDHDRTIAIGPEAQRWLAPYLLKCDAEQFVFRPDVAQAERRAARREARHTPMRPMDAKREARKTVRKYRPRYTTDSLDSALAHACRKAGMPRFGVHRLRHARATDLKRQGVSRDDIAAVLGNPSCVDLYIDMEEADRAAEVMRKLG